MMTHYTIQCGTLPPILWCITYYLCRLGSISGFISCYCTLLSPIYRKEIFSFWHHIILSCLVHCIRRFLPRSVLIFISTIHILGVDYSLIIYFCSFYAIFGIWLHNIWYQSCFLGTGFSKLSHIGKFTTLLWLQGIRY